MTIQTISPITLNQIVQSGQSIELLDVRMPTEYREIHVAFARNVPLDKLDATMLAAGQDVADRTLYVICQSGSRSAQGCEKLLRAGYANVVSVEGGTRAWEQAGLPVVRGKKALSLERQVRMTIGTMVAIGTALGAFVNPYWLILPGFAGCGLFFAGITDRCLMGMLFAKLPWNQVSGAQACCHTAPASTCAADAH